MRAVMSFAFKIHLGFLTHSPARAWASAHINLFISLLPFSLPGLKVPNSLSFSLLGVLFPAVSMIISFSFFGLSSNDSFRTFHDNLSNEVPFLSTSYLTGLCNIPQFISLTVHNNHIFSVYFFFFFTFYFLFLPLQCELLEDKDLKALIIITSLISRRLPGT